MLTRLATLALTTTALVPVVIAYSLVAFLTCDPRLAKMLFLVAVLLSALCWVIWNHALKYLERLEFQITTAEIADHENIALLLLYLLPLVTIDGGTLGDWRLWGPVALVVALGVYTSYSVHFNPLLGILRWHFYRVTTPEGMSYLMITKQRLAVGNATVIVGQLTEYMVVDLKGD